MLEDYDYKKWSKSTMSKYLLYKKFDYKEGLCEKLDSHFVGDGLKGDLGIVDTPSNIKQRQEKYGINEYPRKGASDSFMKTIGRVFEDDMLKVLFLSAIMVMAIGVDEYGLYEGCMEGISIILSFFMITILDAYFSVNINEKVKKMREKMHIQDNIVTFRRNIKDDEFRWYTNECEGFFKYLKTDELVVGDIYEFTDGMRVPADSVILYVDKTDNPKGLVEVNEGDVTGFYCQQTKSNISDKNLKDNATASNILYSQSYVISGKGKAIVCCVGFRTQAGMPVETDVDLSFNKRKTPLKDILV